MGRYTVREIRAQFDDETVVVYQAFPREIAEPAVLAGTLVAPFRMDRMTWIKPSFLWMMYRSGWASKPGQERVLRIRISRSGFDEALSCATLSHFDSTVHSAREEWLIGRGSDVVVQWDPDRDHQLRPLPWRAIQVGLRGEAAQSYVHRWITGIEDITAIARAGWSDSAARIVNGERRYTSAVRCSAIGAI